MVQTYRLEYKGINVTIAKEPFAGGGEGNLYAIVEPLSLMNHVAKIYHDHKRTEERRQKINYLAQYPPEELFADGAEQPSIVWVEDALYDEHKFVGFIMPFTSGEKLEILCTTKIPRKLRNAWKRFDYKRSDQALDRRLKLGFNICAAIYKVHSMQRYVLVDMKPDNIVIQPNGLVSIVDTDSVEVVEDGQSLFDAPVATPEYTPPEHYRTLEYDPTERDTWDRFGLGVILYKLLFGIHPFAASSKPPFDHLVSLDDKIKEGLFVHAPAGLDSFQIIPPPHQKFKEIDPNLQALFIRCFVDGHQDPEQRPTAQEWCATILTALDDEAVFKRYAHVLGFKGGINQPRFKRPSKEIQFPAYNNEILNMVDLYKMSELPTFNPNRSLVPTKFEFDAIDSNVSGTIFFVFFAFVLFNIFGPFAFLFIFFQLRKHYNAYQNHASFIRKKKLEIGFKTDKKQLFKQMRKAKVAHRKYKGKVRSIMRSATTLLDHLKLEINQLQQFVVEQDAKVEQIEQHVSAKYEQIHQKYVDKAVKNRAISRLSSIQSNSLLKLKIAFNQSYKIAVDRLTKNKDIRNHPEMQQGKIAVESLLAKQKKSISQALSEAIEALNHEEELALDLIENSLEEEANIEQHIRRLWTGYRRIQAKDITAALNYFHQEGLTSIRQISSIDNRAKSILLKNGKEIYLRPVKNAKVVLRNFWQWYDEIKHKRQALRSKESSVKDRYRIKIKALDEDKRHALKDLERTKSKELQAVKVAVQKQLLGPSFEKLHTEYQTTQSYFTELEHALKVEEEVVLQDYEADYQQIIFETEQRVKEAKIKITALENKLKVHSKKLQHSGFQKKYHILKIGLQELKQQLPILEKKSEELQKYRNINFVNYLKKTFSIKSS